MATKQFIVRKLENGTVEIEDTVKSSLESFSPSLKPVLNGPRVSIVEDTGEVRVGFQQGQVLKVVREDGTEVFIPTPATGLILLYTELRDYFFFVNTKKRLDYLESIIYEFDYREIINIETATAGSITIPDGGEVDTTEYIGNSLLSTQTGGKLDFKTPQVGLVKITSSLDVNGNWTVTDTFPDPVALVYRLKISAKDYFNIDQDKRINFFLIGSEGGGGLSPVFEFKTFDVENDSLPITANNDTTNLKVDLFNFDQDIDLTGNLPVNMQAGARVVLRKTETNRFRASFNDGVVNYKFLNRKGDYLELYWTGTNYTI